jgi:hypothetical protein
MTDGRQRIELERRVVDFEDACTLDGTVFLRQLGEGARLNPRESVAQESVVELVCGFLP